jgi:hypothetical protein
MNTDEHRWLFAPNCDVHAASTGSSCAAHPRSSVFIRGSRTSPPKQR